MPDDHRYIIACTIILNYCYGYNLNFKRPFYYEIPDANGVLRYYKILYNADFCEIEATDKAKKITQEDYNQLLDNFDNLALWKEKFPPDSYIFNGFVISNIFDVTEDQSMVVKDLCSGHGLTGMLFAACNPPGRLKASMRVLLVDQSEPQSHSILRDLISEVCPWVNQDTVQFFEADLDDYVTKSLSDVATDEASIIISTHACGSLTDDVIRYAVESRAASVSVMPCCYTGTAKGTPYGVQRMLGVSASADILRSFLLHDAGYHVDFAAIPKAITPMNRLIVAERRC